MDILHEEEASLDSRMTAIVFVNPIGVLCFSLVQILEGLLR
jgi:hypothetical protein